MVDLLEGTFCFNGFPCREKQCKAYDKNLKECVFIVAARINAEIDKSKKIEEKGDLPIREKKKTTRKKTAKIE